jgi:mono/diheme cytochrome c family protein
MKLRFLLLTATVISTPLLAPPGSRALPPQEAAPAPSSPQFYDARVKPILSTRCYKCHTDRMSGGLRVDSRETLLTGGDSGPAIVPGETEKSLLIEAVRQQGDLKMPKGGKLSDQEVADLEAWVKAGAVWSEIQKTQTAEATTSATPSAPNTASVQNPGSNDFFENKVRPILANNCYTCHTDGAAANLHVDSRESLMKGGKSGPALVPGDPAKSLMIQAVEQTGRLKMPQGGRLTAAEVETLKVWVKMGAPWENTTARVTPATDTVTPQQRAFWSFQPIQMPEEPKVKDGGWAKTPIDKFVLAKLESQGLKPAPPADKLTLIRRATFDLTGLPPTPEEIEAFVKDKSPNAFAKVVDRLLASPRYGERWGRHWLDVARYAEDDVRGLDPRGRGYMPFEGAYVFRDWVIKSINEDIPYDQFVRLQLAGDFLARNLDGAARHDALAATAYIGDGPWLWDQAEPIQGRADERAERVDAVSRGLMGLTVGCARCHNHKYDPISQRDYYSMVGLFANSTFREYPMASPEEVASYQEKLKHYVDLQKERDEFNKMETRSLANALAYQTSNYVVAAWRVSGKPKMKVEEAADKANLDPQLLQRWVDYLKNHHNYPYLNDWQAMVASGGEEDEARTLADIFQKIVLSTNVLEREIEKDNEAIRIKAGSEERSRYIDTTPDKFETFDQFCPGCALTIRALPAEQNEMFEDLFVGRRSDAMERAPGVLVFRGWELKRRLNTQWQDYLTGLDAQIAAAKKALPPYPFVNGVADKPKIEDVHLNLRGNPHNLGDPVPRRFLAVLSSPAAPPFHEGSGRLEFANVLVKSPTFTRVIVNRVWKWHFGTGIVNTPDDFGIRGDAPSNPELLEYLSAEFQKNGMSLKKLHREIMLSAVYQTSDEESPEAHEKDAANRYYSHFSRQRMDAETLRDSILYVAGNLDLKDVSGPSVEFGPDNMRRTVFCKVSRFRLDPYLEAFDFPNPGFSADQRFSSNVPLQRLYFMNDPFIYSQAEKVADRVYPKPDDQTRIDELYLILYGRRPTAKELALGETFVKGTPEKPGYTIQGKPVTAWKEYARVLLSSNEFEFVN